MNTNAFKIMAKIKSAFTISEVIIAIVIVGIIAGLVLPATITRFQEKGFDQAYERNVNTIANAVNALIVSENKNFFKTEMYSDTESPNYDETSGKFMKKYLKLSTYCGSGEDNAKKCFSANYYKYENKTRSPYTPELKGACAKLKNGASICVEPQVTSNSPIRGIIDLNGSKGPNIYGRDLRKFSLSPVTRIGALDRSQYAVFVTTAPDLGEEIPEEPESPPEEPAVPPSDPCAENPTSLECCKTKTITSASDGCCNTHPELSSVCTPPSQHNVCDDEPHGLACCQKQGVTSTNRGWCCGFDEFSSNNLCKKTITFAARYRYDTAAAPDIARFYCTITGSNNLTDSELSNLKCSFTISRNDGQSCNDTYPSGSKLTMSKDAGAYGVACSIVGNNSLTLKPAEDKVSRFQIYYGDKLIYTYTQGQSNSIEGTVSW